MNDYSRYFCSCQQIETIFSPNLQFYVNFSLFSTLLKETKSYNSRHFILNSHRISFYLLYLPLCLRFSIHTPFLLSFGKSHFFKRCFTNLISLCIIYTVLVRAFLYYPSKRQYVRLFGPIAQLGERTVRIRKVVGSIPIRSTKAGNRRSENCGDFSFDHKNTTEGLLFYHWMGVLLQSTLFTLSGAGFEARALTRIFFFCRSIEPSGHYSICYDGSIKTRAAV